MASPDTDPTGERASWVRPLAVVVLVVIFGSSTLALVSRTAGGPVAAGVGAMLLVGLLFAFWRRRSGTSAMDRSDADDVSGTDSSTDSSVWNAIPPWQYDGRHAESGGLTRGEQEQALHEIQQEAEELSAEPSQEGDPER